MNPPDWPDLELGLPARPKNQRPEPDALEPAPWEDPERPRLIGFYQTMAEVLSQPMLFFSRPALGGPAEPFAFGLITGTIGSLLGLLWWLLFLLAANPELKRSMAQIADLNLGVIAGVMALIPLVVLTKLALACLCLWGAAALLGARVGLASIWRLCCYATAASALAVVPFLGSLLAGPMALFILHQGLRGALGMSCGRALGGLAVFLILQLLATVFLFTGLLALLGLLGLLLLG